MERERRLPYVVEISPMIAFANHKALYKIISFINNGPKHFIIANVVHWFTPLLVSVSIYTESCFVSPMFPKTPCIKGSVISLRSRGAAVRSLSSPEEAEPHRRKSGHAGCALAGDFGLAYSSLLPVSHELNSFVGLHAPHHTVLPCCKFRVLGLSEHM